jgi:phospholipase/carboxylesterase
MSDLPAPHPVPNPASAVPTLRLAIESLPAQGVPEQLFVLLHGVGGQGAGLAALAQVLRHQFPKAAILAPDAPHPFDGGVAGTGRQWFSVQGITEDNRPERVAQALQTLLPWLKATQARLGLGPQATALAGFSQGAILAVEAVLAEDGLAGRVAAFSGRLAQLPTRAPRLTTLHWFHGSEDPVIPVQHARAALEHLGVLHGDATLDIAQGLGHEMHPALFDRLIHRLTHHIPQRSWQAAMGAVPAEGGGGLDALND